MRTLGNGAKESGMKVAGAHEHRAVVVHVLGRRDGFPFEIERRVCATCARVLDERPLRRADA